MAHALASSFDLFGRQGLTGAVWATVSFRLPPASFVRHGDAVTTVSVMKLLRKAVEISHLAELVGLLQRLLPEC